MIASINTNIATLEQAAALTGLDERILRHLVRYDIVPGIAGSTGPGTCDIVTAKEIAKQVKAIREPLEQSGISALEAETKYGFSNVVIYKWHRAGWIGVHSVSENGDRLFKEADIAFARLLADKIGHTNGRPVFPPKPRSGRPRKP